MALLQTIMRVYQYLLHPGIVLAAVLLFLVYREWAVDDAGFRGLVVRVGTLLGIELVAVAPVGLYLLARRPSVTRLTAGSDWRINLVTAASLLVGGGLVWYVWSANGWGESVGGAGAAVVATAVPYALVAPVWNVSGHVTFTLVPTLVLALTNEKYWPALAVPLVMVVNRPVLGAHTWLQSLGGLALGTVGVLAARRR